MNDGIDPQDFSLQYIKVDQVIRRVSRHGPVHPNDHFSLGMRWRGQFYVDISLPFGLRSAPFNFNSVADMVEWVLLHKHRLSVGSHYYHRSPTVFPVCL